VPSWALLSLGSRALHLRLIEPKAFLSGDYGTGYLKRLLGEEG
jgi:hypothetical protein